MSRTILIAITAENFVAEKVSELLHAAKHLGGLSVELVGFGDILEPEPGPEPAIAVRQ